MPDPKPQIWFVYMIEASDNSLYTGITTDIERRWQQHTLGRGARFFRGRKPVRLRRLEAGFDRQGASQREAEIKKLSRSQKLLLIASSDEPAQPQSDAS